MASGSLDKDESIIFFANYADMLAPFLESTCELCTTQQMDMMQMRSPGKLMEAFRAEMAKLKASHLVNVDKHHQAAFAALDTNKDGKIQEKEVVEALLHGHRKNDEFMHALGLVVDPTTLIGATAAEVMEGAGEASCVQQ